MKLKKSLEAIIAENSRQLEKCYEKLFRIMPEYFFVTFNDEVLGLLLPCISQLLPGSPAIERKMKGKLYRMYLASHDDFHSYNLAETLLFRGALIHESTKPFVSQDGKDYYLVVEEFTMEPEYGSAGRFSFKQICDKGTKLDKATQTAMKSLYERLNWSQLTDLTADRLFERMLLAIKVEGRACAAVQITERDDDFRLLVLAQNAGNGSSYFNLVVAALNLYGFNIKRAYWREFAHATDINDLEHTTVDCGSFYFSGDKSRLAELERAVRALYWGQIDDIFYKEFCLKRGLNPADAAFFRAAAEFLHSQFAFVNHSAYMENNIKRIITIYPELSFRIFDLFCAKFDPAKKRPSAKTLKAEIATIEAEIAGINSGLTERDVWAKNIFTAMLTWVECILKCNFFVPEKGALAFRLSPDFMKYFGSISQNYVNAFPADRPFGVFFFYRSNAAGFQIRFSDIARGGWRTVIPRRIPGFLESRDLYNAAHDEIFREGYVLAHTQHMKNKDIYEGGSKMIMLLDTDLPRDKVKPTLWEAQAAVFDAFLSLINCDEKGVLREKNIVDALGKREIIEIGPDENMFDTMISYMGNYADARGYVLGSGIISGKPESGINHKEYGVTSFGVHTYLLRTLKEFGINPFKDDFTVKISGGPFGDVAGNMMKLLLRTEKGKPVYPKLRITAITDGPAAIYDPAGIDRAELGKLLLKQNLDAFDPKKLKGEGAIMLFSEIQTDKNGDEYHRAVEVRNGKNVEITLTRDDFMRRFQSNLESYADFFIPCGGRPSTINSSNWENYVKRDGKGSLAIVEGANSFLTPDARIQLQKNGVLIVKDASANKCGVITSSYEILSGLMLKPQEFIKAKPVLVPQVMQKLEQTASREAEWLFSMRHTTGRLMTELTEELSRSINSKNIQIGDYLDAHPELISDKIILEHLPEIFRKEYKGRLHRIPAEYRKAIVSVELAARIIYTAANGLEDEIARACK
ncbi:MAG: NAD-glutamate dehydrogenase [Victivallales bacterium]|nr:NAD-glutamate dehydrogenase [Victivallales bacterium]